ncbi:hypothetical protein FOA52_005750 [Chlamydomonas sp. UWO 241]|nr:hypothetical protein FOA52_005750 [Chlamydomonas sp. UWO 241]
MARVEGQLGLRAAHRWLYRLLVHMATQPGGSTAGGTARGTRGSTAAISSWYGSLGGTGGGSSGGTADTRSGGASMGTGTHQPIPRPYAMSVALALDSASTWAVAPPPHGAPSLSSSAVAGGASLQPDVLLVAPGGPPVESDDDLLDHVDLSDAAGVAHLIVARQVRVAGARHSARMRLLGANLADKGANDAMDALATMASHDGTSLVWLHDAGVLPLLQRLAGVPDCAGNVDGGKDGATRAGGQPASAAALSSSTSDTSNSREDSGGEGGGGGAGGGGEAGSGVAPQPLLGRTVPAASASSPALASSLIAPPTAPLSSVNEAGAAALGVSVSPETSEEGINSDHDGSPKLGMRRQAARLLALLSLTHPGAADVASAPWRTWLECAAKSDDCRLASHAAKALLHLAATSTHAADNTTGGVDGVGSLDGVGGVNGVDGVDGPGGPPVFGDMVHLLVPRAGHHAALARRRPVARARGAGFPREPELPPPPTAAAPLSALYSSGSGSDGGGGGGGGVGEGGGDGGAPGRSDSGNGSGGGGPSSEWAGSNPGEPAIDVVFVHGIRGGPFITWRKKNVSVPTSKDEKDMPAAARAANGSGNSSSSGSSSSSGDPSPKAETKAPRVPVAPASQTFHLPLSSVWPSDWLATDFPTARLLTVEYAAPFTNYEVESLPLEETAARVTRQLLAAGVGTRPVVFVCHSMGGLLMKEVLAQALSESANEEWADTRPHTTLLETSLYAGGAITFFRLTPVTFAPTPSRSTPSANIHLFNFTRDIPERPEFAERNTRGILFFATPHFGSNLAAMGWKLRALPGARPAPSLARLTPGPHLIELNAALQSLHDQRGLHVVSLLEGQPTEFGVLPRMFIVPEESGYPGFGERIVLGQENHVQLCKPASKETPGYVAVHSLVEEALRAASAGGSGGPCVSSTSVCCRCGRGRGGAPTLFTEFGFPTTDSQPSQ